jgi:hypothetical protein
MPEFSTDNEVELICQEIVTAVTGLTVAADIARACKAILDTWFNDVWIRDPDESTKFGYAPHRWHLGKEGGPPDWGVAASFAIIKGTGNLCETYWGFDLIFYGPNA